MNKRRLGLAALIVFAALLAVLTGWALHIVRSTPGLEDMRQVQASRPSVLLTADGKTLALFRRQQREPVKLAEVSPYVVKALIATEDRRFYEHKGVDYKRTAAAAFHTLRGTTQGGSTITQQLARNLFPEDIGRARNLNRKLKEIVAARRIEQAFSKDQILEHYLNSTPFLYNAVGIEMAARTYFDKQARTLDAAEAATLVGMLKGTHYYNPVMFPERALKRRNLVLQQMAATGALGAEEAEALKRRPLGVKLNRPEEADDAAPHFTAQAKRWALNWADQHDIDLYSEGLVIETTLDSRLQQMAEKAVQRQGRLLQSVADVEWASAAPRSARSAEAYADLAKSVQPFRYFFEQRPDLLAAFLRETPEFRQAIANGQGEAQALKALKADAQLMARVRKAHTRLEAGFLAVDPQTGEVKAWVGSRDFAEDQFDHVAQAARQPGSTFKPIVYAAALEAGIGPERAYLDGPVEVRLDARTVWRPTDMQGFTGLEMTLRDGLVYSKNTITAQVSQEVGVHRIVALAQAMGIERSKLDAVPSLALGTSPVSLYEMVGVYCTIAAQGTRHKPLFVRSIKDRHGKVLAEFVSEPQRALSAGTAIDLIDMMRGVVSVGTGAMVKSRFNLGADIAGKTGTTQNNTDGWFILMHPNLVAGAWVGFNDQRVTMRSDYWGQGGHNAVLLVGDFFREAIKGRLLDTGVSFPPPRRPPVVTAWAPPPEEVTEAAVFDEEITVGDQAIIPNPGATPATPATPITRTSTSGTTTYGDPAGVEAMRHNNAPPKSAEELERAFGRDAPVGDEPPVIIPPPQ